MEKKFLILLVHRSLEQVIMPKGTSHNINMKNVQPRKEKQKYKILFKISC